MSIVSELFAAVNAVSDLKWSVSHTDQQYRSQENSRKVYRAVQDLYKI